MNILSFYKTYKLIYIIIISGFILKITCIFWGIPFPDSLSGYYHPDEYKIVSGAFEFPHHIFTNKYLYYPTFFPYLLAILILPVRSFCDYLCINDDIVITSYVAARTLTLVFGTLAIIMTYYLSNSLLDKKRAILSSLFVTFSFYHFHNSTFATTDVPTSCLLLIFIIFMINAQKNPVKLRNYVYAGITFGLLVGTKYTGILFGVVYILYYAYFSVLLLYRKDKVPINAKTLHLYLSISLFISLLIFFITTPGILIEFNNFLSAMKFVVSDVDRWRGLRTDWITWYNAIKVTSTSTSIPITALFLAGLVYPIKKNKLSLALIISVLFYYIYMGPILKPRYVIIIVPLISIIASNLIFCIYETECKIARILSVFIIVTCLIYSFLNCIAGIYYRINDTRTQAAHFIENNLPPKSSIGIIYESKKYDIHEHPWRYPKIDFQKYQYSDFLNYPKYIVSTSFEVDTIEKALSSEYLSNDFVWNPKDNYYWYGYSPPSPKMFRFFDKLFNSKDSGYNLLVKFKKADYSSYLLSKTPEFSSPEIRIYVRKY